MEQIWIHEINFNVVNLEDCTGHNEPAADNAGSRGSEAGWGY